jgi:hypothetical protein
MKRDSEMETSKIGFAPYKDQGITITGRFVTCITYKRVSLSYSPSDLHIAV